MLVLESSQTFDSKSGIVNFGTLYRMVKPLHPIFQNYPQFKDCREEQFSPGESSKGLATGLSIVAVIVPSLQDQDFSGT